MKRNRNKKKKGRKAGRGVAMLDPSDLGAMRAAGRLAAELLDRVGEIIAPGITTADIDALVDEITEKNGAVSAPYMYRGTFPGHCCTSINDVVCHGIPSASRVLKDGDIINVDVTPKLGGLHGDSSRTFLVGEVSPVARRLVADTYRCLWLGIRAIRPGGHIGDIGHAIQRFAEAQGHSVVREFTGHGTGRIFHTAPSVLHYGSPGTGEPIVPGMTFTVEPMINVGHWKTEILEDDWTAVTVDGSLSAQFEHTCLVTEDGVEVLTQGPNEPPPL